METKGVGVRMEKIQTEGLAALFLVPSDYASLRKKGTAFMILERDEGGFFKKVVSVHAYASQTQTMALNETHSVVEFGPDYPFSFLMFKGGGLINYLLKPIPIIRSLAKLIRHNQISLIRATDPFWCGFYGWAASTLTGIPFCVSIHTDYEKYYQMTGRKRGIPLWFKILEKFVLPRAHLVMPIRESLVPDMVKKGVNPNKIRVIPHGVVIQDFLGSGENDISPILDLPPDKKLLSFVGRVAEDNYVDDLVELASRLSKTRNDFILAIVGEGPEATKLKTRFQDAGLSSAVIFTGFQPRKRVISILRRSYLALCLKGGFSLIEACAAARPVISYDIEWHYELVKSGETGFLIKERDWDALTKSVIWLLDHPEDARTMGGRAREIAIARHDLSRASEVKKNVYKQLLSDPDTSRNESDEDLSNNGIRHNRTTPSAEIRRGNPWYTDDQFVAAQGHQSRTLQQRYQFIRQVIEGHVETRPLQKRVRILDAGCGDGVQLQVLSELSGKGVWGIDYNLLRIQRAQKNVPTANVICGDLLHLPFQPETFDVVVCSQVIEHIPEDTELLKSLASVLRSRGLMVLGTPNEGCFMARMRNHLLEPTIMKMTDHAHFYTEQAIRRKIEGAGFLIQQVMRENWFFPLQRLNHFCSTRRLGMRLMACLNKTFPSQTAGYYFRCVKSG